jgi:hypothetical protein
MSVRLEYVKLLEFISTFEDQRNSYIEHLYKSNFVLDFNVWNAIAFKNGDNLMRVNKCWMKFHVKFNSNSLDLARFLMFHWIKWIERNQNRDISKLGVIFANDENKRSSFIVGTEILLWIVTLFGIESSFCLTLLEIDFSSIKFNSFSFLLELLFKEIFDNFIHYSVLVEKLTKSILSKSMIHNNANNIQSFLRLLIKFLNICTSSDHALTSANFGILFGTVLERTLENFSELTEHNIDTQSLISALILSCKQFTFIFSNKVELTEMIKQNQSIASSNSLLKDLVDLIHSLLKSNKVQDTLSLTNSSISDLINWHYVVGNETQKIQTPIVKADHIKTTNELNERLFLKNFVLNLDEMVELWNMLLLSIQHSRKHEESFKQEQTIPKSFNSLLRSFEQQSKVSKLLFTNFVHSTNNEYVFILVSHVCAYLCCLSCLFCFY